MKCGDVYRFVGLPGQETEVRTLTLLGISVTGHLSFRLEMEGVAPGLVSIDLLTFDAMFDQGFVKVAS